MGTIQSIEIRRLSNYLKGHELKKVSIASLKSLMMMPSIIIHRMHSNTISSEVRLKIKTT